jgi:hypothetical protein
VDLAIFQELFLGGIIVLVMDFKAIELVGIWMALRSNGHRRAVVGTLGRVLLPAWAGIFVAYFLLVNSSVGSGAAGFMFLGWFLLGFVVDVLAAAKAWWNLQAGFRSVLTEAKPARWRRGWPS